MGKTEILSSPANPLIKEVRRAIQRGTLTRDGYCVAETFHLLEEALRSGCEIQAVLAAESAGAAAEAHGARVVLVSDRLFASVSATQAPQGVLALVRPPAWSLDQLFGPRSLLLVLDGLQDPGNAGAILRAAEAFGATGVVFLKGTVSPYNPKAVRASAGSLFRVPIVAGLEPAPVLASLKEHGLDVYAARPQASRALDNADLTRPCAFLIGSEGHGITADLQAGAEALRIPVSGVESLNAAMAAGILLYETRRQREPVTPAGRPA